MLAIYVTRAVVAERKLTDVLLREFWRKERRKKDRGCEGVQILHR